MSLEIFKELQRRVQQKIQNDDTVTTDLINNFLPKCKVWLNDAYERIVRSKPWEEIGGRKFSLQIIASQAEYALNRDVWQVDKIFDKTNGRWIAKSSRDQYVIDRAPSLDTVSNVLTGDPTVYFPIGYYTSKNSISSAEKVTAVSSSASDTSPITVQIRGLVSSVEIQETIVLNGTTTVNSVNTYDASQKLAIHIGSNDGSQSALTGIVTVSGVTSSTVYSKIAPRSQATEYQWIQVSTVPSATGTQPIWDVWYKRNYPKMVNDSDMPLFDCSMAIVQGAYTIALEEDGQDSQLADSKFVALVEELWASRNNPNDTESFQPAATDYHATLDFNRQIQRSFPWEDL